METYRPSVASTLSREAASLALPLAVAHFAFRTSPLSRLLIGGSAALAVAGSLLIATRPDAFVREAADGATLVPANGLPSILLSVMPFYAMLGFAALAFLDRANAEGSLSAARSDRLVASGTIAFLGSATAWFGTRTLAGLGEFAAARGVAEAGASLAVFLVSACLLVAAALRIHRDPARHEDKRILVLSLYGPALASFLAAGLVLGGGPRLNLVPIWRIVMVALIVLAVMRHRLFDREVRFKRTVLATLSLFFAGSVALLAEGVARSFDVSALTHPSAALVVGAVFASALVVPYLPASRRAARRAFRALVEPHDPSRAQDLEVYRAALEARASRGESLAASEPALARLRSELRVDAREHDLLALFVDRRRGAGAPAFAPGARILDGTLTVEREIGAGGSARVYEARDEAGRAVAVKVHPPLLHDAGATGARAVNEARMLDGVRSANVLRVVEVADRPEAFYVVTERASGTLADRLARGPPVAPAEALRIAREVLTGLAAAHAAGIVHRDVKPANVLLDASGRALLADFDAAGAAGDRGSARGTPAWMAPEQFAGDTVGPAADVHAVGALLYRMLAGRHYLRVDGLGADGMRLLVERAEPPLPAEWPAEVRAWLARALAKEPAARFADARAALGALPREWVTP